MSDATQRKIGRLKISQAVAIIVGLDPRAAHYNDRVKAMRQLTRHLSSDDCQALQLFLAGGSSGQSALRPLEFAGLKNDVLGVLLRQERVPDGVSRLVLDMYRDKTNEGTWRTYCLQYMVTCYDALAAPSTTDTNAAAERQEIADACRGAVAEKGNPDAGTALLCMETISRNHPEFDRGKLADAAAALAIDETCGEATRITALGVCATMGKTAILPVAKALAQTGETVPLRMAATAAVGDLGGGDDAELLRSLATDGDKRIALCARAALARLNKKLATQTI